MENEILKNLIDRLDTYNRIVLSNEPTDIKVKKLNYNGDYEEINVPNLAKVKTELKNTVTKPDFDSNWISNYAHNTLIVKLPFKTCIIKVFARIANYCSRTNAKYVEILPCRAYNDNFATRGIDICWTFSDGEVEIWGDRRGGRGGDISDGCRGMDIRVLAWKGVEL